MCIKHIKYCLDVKFKYLFCFIKETVTITIKEYNGLKQHLQDALSKIEELLTENALLKSGRNSNTSSTPSSQDYTRVSVPNLREKSGKPSGGQKGHKGSTLKMTTTPSETIKYIPKYCKDCGLEFNSSEVQFSKKRQEIVIPPIVPKYIEHQSYKCSCKKCGTTTEGNMPQHLKANIQYGQNIQSLVTYLSVYQYLPSKRLKQFISDYFNIEISEGTIFNILASMSNNAKPSYNEIRRRLEIAKYVGGDETGAHINNRKAWFWIFQNDFLTFIRASYSRGYKTISETFTDGFPMSIYVSDSLAAQLKINTLGKQLCLAHLMRELKKFEEVFNSHWATQLKHLFKKATDHKKQMQEFDYNIGNQKIKEFENELSKLLEPDIISQHKKEQAFINRLRKRRDAIFTFLYYPEVPPDNNASERGIRNIKVKMKISNQFKSYEFAQHFAIIRSVIDTTLKNGQDVFNSLNLLTQQNLIPAE